MLYERTNELRRQGLSYSQIGKTLGVGKRTVGLWVHGHRPRRVWRFEPDLTPSPELAYLLGFYLGDGRSAGKESKVRFKLADREQLELVSSLVARILRRKPKAIGTDGPFFTVDYDSVALARYLDSPLERLMPCIERYKEDFLRGFFDAEGYASCHVDPAQQRVTNFCVGVANTNTEYVGLVRNLLEPIGIKSSIIITNKKGQAMTIRNRTWIRKHDVYHLQLWSRANVKAFAKKIGFGNPTKAKKLKDLVALIDMNAPLRYDWFRARYRRTGRKWTRCS